MLLAELRGKRRAAILRNSAIARATVRTQRGDLARLIREWNRVSKRINGALIRYGRSVDDIGLIVPDLIQPRDLVECFKGCSSDNQLTLLDNIDEILRDSERELKAAARKESRRSERRQVKRAKRAERAAKRRP